MFQRLKDSKFAWAGAAMVILGAAGLAYPPADLILHTMGMPTGGPAIATGLGILFGRDTVQKFLETMRSK